MGFLTSVLYIVLAICVLLFMITIHEFGHYSAGKLLKFKINEFSIGFGKVIYSKTKKNGEKFSIRIFPMGGFCAFEGEDEDGKNNPEAFNNQKAWKRLVVLFMGAFFNFLSAIIFSIILLMSFGYADKVQIKTVEKPDYVAEENWLMQGDVIHAVNGVETNFVYDNYFISMISDFDVGSETENYFTVSVYRNNEDIDLKVWKSWFAVATQASNARKNTPIFALDGINFDYRIDAEESLGVKTYKVYKGSYHDGIKTYNVDSTTNLVEIDGVKYFVDTSSVSDINDLSSVVVSSVKIGVTTSNYRYDFFEALGQGFVFSCRWALKVLMILGQLITGQLALTNMGGTVTTVVTIAEVAQVNIASLLYLIPIISVNLAVFNLLPFPALDGARMVFVFIEMIRRKPINRNVEANIHFIGLIILFAFVAVVDILHFVM